MNGSPYIDIARCELGEVERRQHAGEVGVDVEGDGSQLLERGQLVWYADAERVTAQAEIVELLQLAYSCRGVMPLRELPTRPNQMSAVSFISAKGTPPLPGRP